MADATYTDSQLSLVPLGPGDLIDRAVRFYRRNFVTFILIAAPPVIAGTAISVAWTMIGRAFFISRSSYDPIETTAYYLFVLLGSVIIWFTETVATLSVMGGASRNFVRHLLFGEAVTFRETYRNVWQRLAALVVSSSVITILLSVTGAFIFYFGLIVGILLGVAAAAVLVSVPFLAFIAGMVIALASFVAAAWLFFLIATRFAFVPQVMMVEGQSVGGSISRSAQLAGGTVKRFAALFIFTVVATYSALAIFYVPLGWYAWLQGIELFAVDRDLIPAWYEVASQLVWQTSLILMTPVWMVGLCLLYVDQRVRREGYDIELMAAQRLGEIPSVPAGYVNPLQPALGDRPRSMPLPVPDRGRSSITTLGLE